MDIIMEFPHHPTTQVNQFIVDIAQAPRVATLPIMTPTIMTRIMEVTMQKFHI
jgi:hypothetical protein